jgi:hypothetical protein
VSNDCSVAMVTRKTAMTAAVAVGVLAMSGGVAGGTRGEHLQRRVAGGTTDNIVEFSIGRNENMQSKSLTLVAALAVRQRVSPVCRPTLFAVEPNRTDLPLTL